TTSIRDIQPVVSRASHRRLIVNTAKNWNSCGCEITRERTSRDLVTVRVKEKGSNWIYVKRFRFTKRKNVNIIDFEHRIRIKLVRVAYVPLLCIWILVVRIHKPTGRTYRQLGRRRWNRRKRIHAEAPISKCYVSSGYAACRVSRCARIGTADAEYAYENRRIL